MSFFNDFLYQTLCILNAYNENFFFRLSRFNQTKINNKNKIMNFNETRKKFIKNFI